MNRGVLEDCTRDISIWTRTDRVEGRTGDSTLCRAVYILASKVVKQAGLHERQGFRRETGQTET